MDAGSVFSTVHIGVTAAIAGTASLLVALVARMSARRSAVFAVAGVSTAATFAWRMVANVGALNEDGIPWVSANDVLAPMVTYMVLGMYASFFPPDDEMRFEQLRVALAGVALVVNVVAI